MSEKRREPRHPMKQSAVVRSGKRVLDAEVQNISFHGAMIKVDGDPPKTRQLVRVELVTPSGATISSHAMVVRTDEAGRAIGVELFGATGEDWAQLVRDAEAGLSIPPPVHSAPPSKERRRYKRFEIVLELRVRTPRSIHLAYSHDMSQGGIMATGADLDVPEGEQVIINVVHPESRASFRLNGTVKRRIPLEGQFAIGVEFAPLDEANTALLGEFLMTAMEVIAHRQASSPPQ